MMTNEFMETRLKGFIEAWKTMREEYTKTMGYTKPPRVVVVDGKRFWKIIVRDYSESTRAFIDKKKGDIYKAASWNAPAKHIRGSILAQDFGMSCMDFHGPKYLR